MARPFFFSLWHPRISIWPCLAVPPGRGAQDRSMASGASEWHLRAICKRILIRVLKAAHFHDFWASRPWPRGPPSFQACADHFSLVFGTVVFSFYIPLFIVFGNVKTNKKTNQLRSIKKYMGVFLADTKFTHNSHY